ncbi:MAG: leucine-rich repeat protein, partial [Clostridia bacterium]|nr:leucine-rich repeat protein [Clostridia bacterium]
CFILKITKESGTVYQSLVSYLGTAETVSTADGLTAIQPFAFEGKTCIKTLYVGHTSSNIYPYAFKGCTQITNLTVSGATAGWRIHEKAFEDLHMVSVLSAPAEVASVIDVSNVEELSLTDGTLSTEAFKGHTKLRKLTIKDCSKICASAFEGCANVTELSVESYEVGENAFKNCTGITSIEVRANTLGAGAFYGCTMLSSAQIEYWSAPGTICDSAFEECTMLSSVEFIRIGTIGSRAFAGCAIVEVELCDQITSFGEEVFSNNLKTVTMCADVAALSPDFLQNLETVTITGGTLKESQFENYDNLKNATLLQGTVLGVSTFKSCNSLTDVSLYQSIDTIPDYAFYGCSSLTTLVMPMNLRTIGVEAFRLSGLKKVSIGDRLETMGAGAFMGLECLTEITIESAELIVIPDEAFKGTSIETFTIPSGVFKISTLAFAECKKLTSISIPSTVSVLSPQAFENCTRLKTAEINCESVGMNAFNYCSSLQTITLGAEVIGKGAFTGCNALSEATFPSGTSWWTMKSGSRYQRVDVSTPENGAGVLKGINLEYPISSRATM